MKKLYLVHWMVDGDRETIYPANSLREIDYLRKQGYYGKFLYYEIWELDDTPFDMADEGIKKTWFYSGTVQH